MKKICLIALCFTLLALPTVIAQDEVPEGCDFSIVLEAMSAASDAIAAGDIDETLTALQNLQNLISITRVVCNGLVFTSVNEGNMPVVGPVTIPEGIYRATATTRGYMIVNVTVISGECGQGSSFLSEYLFNLGEGEANRGAETIFTSMGCDALIAFSNVSDPPWTLEFEKIS